MSWTIAARLASSLAARHAVASADEGCTALPGC
jgi:hypothetical protein